MAKKPAKTTQFSIESAAAAAAAPQKAPATRAKKHLKAQALGVAAAVEGFVTAITKGPVEVEQPPVEAAPEQEVTPVPAPIASTPVVEKPVEEKSAPAPVSHEQIAALAYSYYQSRNGQAGSQADDWFRAEQTLKAGA